MKISSIVVGLGLLGHSMASFAISSVLPNGFYRLYPDGKKTLQPTFQPASVRLESRDNLNQKFYLSFTVPFERTEEKPLILIVNEIEVRSTSKGSNQDKETSYGFEIKGAQVKSVGAFLKVKPQFRSHPGHQFAATFQSSKERYEKGEAVTLKLSIWNLGQRPFALMAGGRNRGARDNQFSFTAFKDGVKALPDVGNPSHLGGLAQRVIIKPGDKFEKDIKLADWFNVTQPGTYSGRGSYYFEVVSTEGGMMPIWEDFATAEFDFSMEEKKPEQ